MVSIQFTNLSGSPMTWSPYNLIAMVHGTCTCSSIDGLFTYSMCAMFPVMLKVVYVDWLVGVATCLKLR